MLTAQGLANLLWAYSKMPVPLVHVIMLIIEEMCARLESDQAEFDAQALSNSIWALAHVRGRVLDLDDRVGGPGMSVRFMLGIASCTLSMLRGLRTAAINSDSANVPACMADAERQFSCQVCGEIDCTQQVEVASQQSPVALPAMLSRACLQPV